MAQDQGPAKLTEVDFRVKRVGLGSSYALVLRRLGRPVSRKRETAMDDTCGPPSTTLRLTYQGAVVELMADLGKTDFEVVSMEITSPRFLITPGVKIGMTEQKVRTALGVPWQESNKSGVRTLNYVTKGNDGGAILYFRNGRLVKVHWQYTLC